MIRPATVKTSGLPFELFRRLHRKGCHKIFDAMERRHTD